MNTLPTYLNGLIINLLDAAECSFFGVDIKMISFEDALQNKDFKFILYYLRAKKYRYLCSIHRHNTQNKPIQSESMILINNIYERMTDIGTMKTFVKINNIDMLFERFDFYYIQSATLDHVLNELMITSINCKNREVITSLKNRSKIVQEWISPIWDAEKILKANFNGDIELLDLVITDLVVDGILGYGMEYFYFDDWQYALNIMLEKGDHVCAEYFQNKLIDNIN